MGGAIGRGPDVERVRIRDLLPAMLNVSGGEYHELVRAILDFNLGPADAQVGNNYTALLIKIGYAVCSLAD